MDQDFILIRKSNDVCRHNFFAKGKKRIYSITVCNIVYCFFLTEIAFDKL